MKRLSPFYAFAGIELLRYFTLAWVLDGLMSGYPPQILRFAAAPNLMFGAAFFFLAMDPGRYGVYRPLILLGKAVTVFAALVAVPRLAGLGGLPMRIDLPSIAGLAFVVAWDVCSALVLLFREFPVAGEACNQAPPAGPEAVEVD